MKIPSWIKDYDDNDSNIKRRQGRWAFWKALQAIREEYYELHRDTIPEINQVDVADLRPWIEETYGIKVISDHMTKGLTDDYEIIDEQKYLFFVLKHLGE